MAQLVMKALYPGKAVSELTETEKQTISALGTLAAGLAGGITGDSTANAVAGAQAGKNAVENNYLSDTDIKTFTKKYAAAKTDEEKEKLVKELKEKDAEQQAKALATAIPIKEQKAEFEKLKALGASPECNNQCQQLVKYSVSQLEPVANDTELHRDNLNKAVLASVIMAFATDRPSPVKGKTPQSTAAAVGKAETSAIDDIVKGSSQAGKVPAYVKEPSFNPAGTAGAAQPWTTKGRINYVQLPTQGKIRFVPDSNYSPSNPLPRGPNNGYVDKFGNEWVKGPSRTAGQAFEWDVQLSPKGKAQLGWATRDGSHLNISLDGKITHK
ncbi:polymorphic toxin type 17 domain-containing protein [Kalamiella sp. sgz302252]|uniref:polymorphic toxin type 17 domain-containing protein n=1 Tax=Pantoea sp. sgz302252 TaxID=3341827 RepID=UPI0036D2F4E2